MSWGTQIISLGSQSDPSYLVIEIDYDKALYLFVLHFSWQVERKKKNYMKSQNMVKIVVLYSVSSSQSHLFTLSVSRLKPLQVVQLFLLLPFSASINVPAFTFCFICCSWLTAVTIFHSRISSSFGSLCFLNSYLSSSECSFLIYLKG